jgi:hypothetical protein
MAKLCVSSGVQYACGFDWPVEALSAWVKTRTQYRQEALNWPIEL